MSTATCLQQTTTQIDTHTQMLPRQVCPSLQTPQITPIINRIESREPMKA